MADVSRLPGPNSDFWDWQLQAACRGLDSAMFFHPEGERGSAKEARERAAKALCSTCPVIMECRAHALRVREPFGVWGGLTEAEREDIYAHGGRRVLTVRVPEARAAGALVTDVRVPEPRAGATQAAQARPNAEVGVG